MGSWLMKIEQDDITFQSLVTFLNLPRVPTDIFKAVATPNVFGRGVWRSSGSVVTITNFFGGTDGQGISIIGDGTTTIENNSNITTNTGADILLDNELVYRFTYLDSTNHWYMDK